MYITFKLPQIYDQMWKGFIKIIITFKYGLLQLKMMLFTNSDI